MYHSFSKLGQSLVEALTEAIWTMAVVYWLVALPLSVAIAASLAWLFFSEYIPRPRCQSLKHARGRLPPASPPQATASSDAHASYLMEAGMRLVPWKKTHGRSRLT